MKKEINSAKGITLIALVVTIIVILILASVGTYNGIEAVKTAQLNKFMSEMKIMQVQVNNIYDKYKNGEEIIANIGKLPSTSSKADNVFQESTSGIVDRSGYRYFDTETIKQLGIEGVEGEFFVNIEKRSIISVDGFEYNGKTYYTMDQIPSSLYNVEYEEKSYDNPTFEINCELSGENKYKVTVETKYSKKIEKWQVKYKLSEESNWNTSDNLKFEIEKAGKYQIQIQNGDIKSDIQEQYLGYITEGLMVHYDGIINTRNGSNGGATAWQDLSGNRNDGVMYNMNSDSGYYNSTDKGYTFLNDSSYIKTSKNIGISGDSLYTIEIVMNPINAKTNGYSIPTFTRVPLMWGNDKIGIVGQTIFMGYYTTANKITFGFVNNSIFSSNTYNIYGKTSNISYKKIRTGQVKNGDTNVMDINYNGEKIESKYEGTATFTPNLVDSKALIGKAWTWGGSDNRTFYGTINSIRIYNRCLTDEETEINYKIDKERFNIQ